LKIDLDAARAARNGKDGEPHSLYFNGQELVLPARMPIGVAIAASKGDVEGLLVSLLGEDGFKTFMAGQPDDGDLQVLAEGVQAAYGVSVGEAPASANSS